MLVGYDYEISMAFQCNGWTLCSMFVVELLDEPNFCDLCNSIVFVLDWHLDHICVHLEFGLIFFLLVKLISWGYWTTNKTIFHDSSNIFSWRCLPLMNTIFCDGSDIFPCWCVWILFSCEFWNSHELISWRWPPRNIAMKTTLKTWRHHYFCEGDPHECSPRK
jgi:hypothetical protein